MVNDNESKLSALSPSTVLVCAPDVHIHLTDDDEIAIDAGGERVNAPRIAHRLLDVFTRPRSLADGLEAIGGRGPEEFIEASSVALQLADARILVAPGARPRSRARGFVKPAIHIEMLDDVTRTQAFCAALRALVGPDDVVIDIGTGTGVLATCAALSGAKRVIAIESTGIANVAERIFAANGVTDRVELVRDRSTRASVSELGNVLVTETIGNDPLDENILEIVADARRRLLVANARIIPAVLEILAVPVEVPAAVFERHVFTQRHIDRYREAYGIEFRPLLDHRLGTAQPIPVATHELCSWVAVAAPTRLLSLDLQGDTPETFTEEITVELSHDVTRLGVALAFRAELAPGIVLSTVPGEVAPGNAWKYVLWPALDFMPLPRGSAITIQYGYERGESMLRITQPT